MTVIVFCLMIRRPPSSTRTDTLFPYTTLFRSGLAQVANGGGYPTCRQWWSDGSTGLRARLLGQVDPTLLNRLAGWAGFLSRAEVDDSVTRAIASPRTQKLNQGSVYPDYGGQIDKTGRASCRERVCTSV